MRRASDPSGSGRPPPAPLVEGEHVLCTIKDCSDDPPVDAVVVALDSRYMAAAKAHAEQQRERELELGDDIYPAAHSPMNGEIHDDVDDDEGSIGYANALRRSGSLGNVSPKHHDSTVDLTGVDTIDLDGDVDGDLGSSEILFREEGKSGITHVPSLKSRKNSISPQAGLSARYKRMRPREVSLPPGIEAYAENGHIKPAALPAPHPIKQGRVYVHFSGRDRRLDRWVNANELERASASSVAAAASRVVENTLVDNAIQADFAVADQQIPARKLTRSRRREYEAINPVSEKEMGNETVARLERAREEKTKVRNISAIVIGEYHVDAWYFSPYPGPYGQVHTLYICKFCLKYVRTRRRYTKHCSTCTWRRPPGALIYQDPSNDLRVYEVDGVVNTVYCQRLCLLAKLFLDHKTLYFDVAPFIFYIVTLGDELAGFFSKENPIIGSEFNLACILTLPQHQRKGVGGFLISLSYEISKIERKTGSPERPLSDLGQLSYRSYWAYTITQFLRSREGTGKVTAKEISDVTAIRVADVTCTLKDLNLIHIWKGETYAETGIKALEVAELKIRRPRLVINSRQLKNRLCDNGSAGKGASSLGRKAMPTRKRPRSLVANDDAFRTQTKRVSNSDGGPNSSKQHRKNYATRAIAPSSADGDGSTGTPRRGFTPEQIMRMADFVKLKTPRVVMATVNQPGGMSSSEVLEFANMLKLPMEKVRKKLRHIAESMVRVSGKASQGERKEVKQEMPSPRRRQEWTRKNGKMRISPALGPGQGRSELSQQRRSSASLHMPPPLALERERFDRTGGPVRSSRLSNVARRTIGLERPSEPDIVIIDSPSPG